MIDKLSSGTDEPEDDTTKRLSLASADDIGDV